MSDEKYAWLDGLPTRIRNTMKYTGMTSAEEARAAILSRDLTTKRFRGKRLPNFGPVTFEAICKHLNVSLPSQEIEKAIILLETNGYQVIEKKATR